MYIYVNIIGNLYYDVTLINGNLDYDVWGGNAASHGNNASHPYGFLPVQVYVVTHAN